jgi:hypothetical protein
MLKGRVHFILEGLLLSHLSLGRLRGLLFFFVIQKVVVQVFNLTFEVVLLLLLGVKELVVLIIDCMKDNAQLL